MPICRRLLVALLCSLCFVAARAQTTPDLEEGLKPYGSFHGGQIDTVNLATGNLTIHIPILSYPQLGRLKLEYSLVYNAESWHPYNGGGDPEIDTYVYNTANDGNYCNPGGVQVVSSTSWCTPAPEQITYGSPGIDCGQLMCGLPPPSWYVWSLEDPLGATHQLAPTTNDSSAHFVSMDATGIRDGITPDGTLLGSIDVFGNRISMSSSGITTDSTGRTIPAWQSIQVSGSRCPQGTTSAMSWTPPAYIPSGTTTVPTYTQCMTLMTIATNYDLSTYAHTSPAIYNGGASVSLMTAFILPNNTRWTFAYDSAGNLQKLTLPTGGSISYTWSNYQSNAVTIDDDGNQVPTYNAKVLTRTVDPHDGTPVQLWQYPDFGTVIDPMGNYSVTSFGGGPAYYPSAVSYYTGTVSPANLLKTVTTTYSFQANPADLQATSINVVPTSVTTSWPSGMSTTTTTCYDSGFSVYDVSATALQKSTTSYNAIRGLAKVSNYYEFGNTPPTSACTSAATASTLPTSQVLTSYVWESADSTANQNYLAANLLSYPTSIQTLDPTQPGAQQQQSLTSYTYDESSYSLAGPTHAEATSTALWNNNGTIPISHTGWYANGQKAYSIDPLAHANVAFGHTIDYQYNQCGGSALTDTFDALGHHTSGTYDCYSGLLTSETDVNGQRSSFTYDIMSRINTVFYPDNTTQTPSVTFNYDDSNLVATRATFAGTSPTQTVTVQFDGLGRETSRSMSDPGDSGAASDPTMIGTTYDLDGRVWKVTNPYRTDSNSTNGTTSYIYDGMGRKTLVTQPDSSTLTWKYLDPAVTETDEASHAWTRTVDGRGRVVSVQEPGPRTTTYSYDVLNNLKSVSQIGVSGETPRGRTFTYNSLSQLITSTNPETGTICYGQLQGGTCGGGYDSNGNLRYKTDANNIKTTFTYDALNRVDIKSYSNGQHSVLFGYDGNAWDGSTLPSNYVATTNVIGRLTYASNGLNADVGLEYDAMGRITNETYCLPDNCGNRRSVTANYDLAGNMTDLWYPDGHHVQQAFDTAGRLSSSMLADINGTSQAQSYVESILYNADNSPNILTLGNGVTQTITKNSRLQVQSMSIGSSLMPFDGSTFLSHGYCHVSTDPGCSGFAGSANNGNIQAIIDNLNGSRTQSFTYDNLNRIQSFTLGGMLNQQYQIDSFGNMTGAYNVPYISCFDSATNRMNNGMCTPTNVTGAPLPPSLVYDSNGNLTQDTDASGSPRTFTYDAENQIVNIATTGNQPFETYVYGADGSRVEKVSLANGVMQSSTEYIDFNGEAIAELDQNGNWTDYIYANGQKVARVSATSHRLHLSGSALQSGAELGVSLPAPANYVVQSGDKVCWQQAVNNAVGGIALFFGNGSNTAWHSQADDGQDFNQDFTSNGWHSRCGDISEYQGQNLVGVQALKDVATPVGVYDLMIADWVLIHPDGTVVQLLTPGINPPLGVQLPDPQYEYFFNAVVEDAGVVQGPSVPVNQMTVRFTNDSCTQCGGSTAAGAGDRNLFINSITVGGTTFLPTDTTDQVSCFQCVWAGGILGDGVQGDSGDLTFTFATPQSGTVTVNAYGSPDLNIYPNMQVLVNGVPVSDFTVTGTAQTYTVTAAGAPTYDTHFLFSDHLGSAQMEFSAGGWPVSFSQFAPFGGELDGQTSANHYKFTGKERDTESGLDYFGARYYASNMGRWMSPDWSKYPAPVPYSSLSDPQTLNLYSYVSNNPLRKSDPDGHHQECAPDTFDSKTNTLTAGACHEVPDWWQFQGARRFLGRHKTAVKVTSNIVIGVTAISGVLDGGASELAVPEEIALEEALLEGGAEAAESEAAAATEATEGTAGEATADSAQMKKLSNGEIKQLKERGIDPHDLKPNSKYDLFKDKNGDIFVKPKAGNGPGDPTGINIKE